MKSNNQSIRDYFESPSVHVMLVILFGMSLNELLAFHSHLVPYESLWVVGKFLEYLATEHTIILQQIFVGAVFIHLCEGLYALKVSKDLGHSNSTSALWFMQTFFIGFPSLGLILSRKAKLSKNKHTE